MSKELVPLGDQQGNGSTREGSKSPTWLKQPGEAGTAAVGV